MAAHEPPTFWAKCSGVTPMVGKLPGELAVQLDCSDWAESKVMDRLVALLEVLPAEVTTSSSEGLEVSVFVDFVLLKVQVLFFTVRESITAVFQDLARNDTVRFHRFFKLAVGCLRLKSPQDGLPELVDAHLDGNWDSESEFESDSDSTDDFGWDEQVGFLGAEVAAELRRALPRASALDACQVLARWAECRPQTRLPIARMVVEKQEIIEAIWKDNKQMLLVVSYPLIVMLKFASLCPQAAAVLASSLAVDAWSAVAQSTEVPRILTQEISQLLQNMEIADEGVDKLLLETDFKFNGCSDFQNMETADEGVDKLLVKAGFKLNGCSDFEFQTRVFGASKKPSLPFDSCHPPSCSRSSTECTDSDLPPCSRSSTMNYDSDLPPCSRSSTMNYDQDFLNSVPELEP
ncbi:unnamed protein product [Polarella glacialis]|uniref:Uncharacterized protein n=1 Tax=Polarella glacialis TaxID=89957 RepID=A0A813JQT8_POLGL|nr:unnamed protein product [Polarella glacialis]